MNAGCLALIASKSYQPTISHHSFLLQGFLPSLDGLLCSKQAPLSAYLHSNRVSVASNAGRGIVACRSMHWWRTPVCSSSFDVCMQALVIPFRSPLGIEKCFDSSMEILQSSRFLV